MQKKSGFNFLSFLFGLTLPIRFPLAVASSAVAVPFFLFLNYTAVVLGTITIKQLNSADQRNIDPDFQFLIDLSNKSFRTLVDFGTYPIGPVGRFFKEKFESTINDIHEPLIKTREMINSPKSDIVESDIKKDGELDVNSSDKPKSQNNTNLPNIVQNTISSSKAIPDETAKDGEDFATEVPSPVVKRPSATFAGKPIDARYLSGDF